MKNNALKRCGQLITVLHISKAELSRTGLYYRARTKSIEDGEPMRQLDEQYTLTPFYSYRRMTVYLRQLEFRVNHKRVLRLMGKLGLEAIYPKPN
jgi:putative transposase